MTNLLRPSILVLALVLAGCGSSNKLRYASDGVARVHAQMDNGQFREIYAQADGRLHAAFKEQDFVDFVGAVHQKLGNVQSISVHTWDMNTNIWGTQVRQTYDTKFEGGDALEKFQWKIAGNAAVLVSYQINSAGLVTR